jgi:hypothetical protein
MRAGGIPSRGCCAPRFATRGAEEGDRKGRSDALQAHYARRLLLGSNFFCGATRLQAIDAKSEVVVGLNQAKFAGARLLMRTTTHDSQNSGNATPNVIPGRPKSELLAFGWSPPPQAEDYRHPGLLPTTLAGAGERGQPALTRPSAPHLFPPHPALLGALVPASPDSAPTCGHAGRSRSKHADQKGGR